MSAADSLARQRIGTYSAYLPSLEAAYTVGHTVVNELLTHWPKYANRIHRSKVIAPAQTRPGKFIGRSPREKHTHATVNAATRARCIASHLRCSRRDLQRESGLGSSCTHPVVDGHEEQQGQNDHCDPDDVRTWKQPGAAPRGVPGTSRRREEPGSPHTRTASRFPACAQTSEWRQPARVIKFPQHRVHKDRDCKFGADQQSQRNNGEDSEESESCSSPGLQTRIAALY